MGLLRKIFNKIIGKAERTEWDIEFEKAVIKDGPKYAGMRIAQVISEKITTKMIAKQFVLEELDAARWGNGDTKYFVQQSGFSPKEYIGAMSNTTWEGSASELEILQRLFRFYLMRVQDRDLMAKLSISVIDEIMKMYKLGKYEG